VFPKCAKTYLRVSAISKIFVGVISPDPMKGPGRGNGMGGRRERDRWEEMETREGRKEQRREEIEIGRKRRSEKGGSQ
jgi:hypothetical protein